MTRYTAFAYGCSIPNYPDEQEHPRRIRPELHLVQQLVYCRDQSDDLGRLPSNNRATALPASSYLPAFKQVSLDTDFSIQPLWLLAMKTLSPPPWMSSPLWKPSISTTITSKAGDNLRLTAGISKYECQQSHTIPELHWYYVATSSQKDQNAEQRIWKLQRNSGNWRLWCNSVLSRKVLLAWLVCLSISMKMWTEGLWVERCQFWVLSQLLSNTFLMLTSTEGRGGRISKIFLNIIYLLYIKDWG